MMIHGRAQIRDAVVNAVRSVPELAGNKTTTDRTRDWQPSGVDHGKLPAAVVFTRQETARRNTVDRNWARELTLTVAIYAQAADDLDDVVDEIAAKVEMAVLSDANLSALVSDVLLSGTTIGLAEGSQPLGVCQIEFTILYLTSVDNPRTIL